MKTMHDWFHSVYDILYRDFNASKDGMRVHT